MAATVAASEPRIEIVGERRRAHDAVFRGRIVAASRQSGTCVRDLARRHGICASLIYRWRRATPPPMATPSVQSCADVPKPAQAIVAAERPLEFVPLGVFGRADDEGPALVTGPPVGIARPVTRAAPRAAATRPHPPSPSASEG